MALSLDYDYGSMGRVTSVTYPDGRVVTQGYDTTGRLTAMPSYLSGSITYDVRSPAVVEPDSLRSQVNGGGVLKWVASTDTVPMHGTTRRPCKDCSYTGFACTRRRVYKRR